MSTIDAVAAGMNDAEVDAAIVALHAAHRTAESRWHRSPTVFASEALGVELTNEQSDIVESVAENTLTSWRSAQKLGKSKALSVLGLWWPFTREGGLCVMTSGNASQVKIILWRELRGLYLGAKVPLGGTLHVAPDTGLTYPDGRLTVGLTADEPERMQGYSGANLLFLVDEASGFSDLILEAITGNLAGGGHALLCGNPTKIVGLFARTHRNKIAGWKLKHTSAYDSPNVKADLAIESLGTERDADKVERINSTRVPGLAGLPWVRQMIETFGPDSAAVAVRVKGEFAVEGDDATIPLALTLAAVQRWTEEDAGGVLELGVDPARFGDDKSSVTPKRNRWVGRAWTTRKLDNVELAAAVLMLLFGDTGKIDLDAATLTKLAGLTRGATWARVGEKPIVRIDVGGLGAGVVDILRRDPRIQVVAVNAGESSRHPERFHDTRAELWWCGRMFLKRGGAMPEDEQRDAELLAAKHFTDPKMRVRVTSKDDMKKVLRRSPDLADSFCLACYGENPLEDAEHTGAAEQLPQPTATPRKWEGAPAFAPTALARDGGGQPQAAPWRPGVSKRTGM